MNREGVFWGLKLVLVAFLITGCVWIFRKSSIESTAVEGEVDSPVKIHLVDGRTALFTAGARFSEDRIEGEGILYSITLEQEGPIGELDRRDVAAYEVFTSEVNVPATVFATAGATAFGVAATGALAVAIFGSCPTIYHDAGAGMVLESELFSNSIAPMLEKRDLVTIKAKPDTGGRLQLEVRNEALETHYINHLELVEVAHDPEAAIYPTTAGTILALSNFKAPVSATDSDGNDLRNTFAENDELAYHSAISGGEKAADVRWDRLELVFPPSDVEDGALYMKLRNSLFTTVLLYDYLLAGQGVESLDWVGSKLGTVSGAVALGDFNYRYMGLRIEQYVDGEYRPVGRIPNTGPIAWREVAIPLATVPGDSLRLRLRFLADSWRIDKVKVATGVTEPGVRYLPVATVRNAGGIDTPEKVTILSKGDEDYLVTYPGQRFTVTFDIDADTGAVPGDRHASYSYLLAGQGYYIEWIRNDWLEQNPVAKPLEYSGDLIVRAQQRWLEVKDDFEQRFFESKVPVQ